MFVLENESLERGIVDFMEIVVFEGVDLRGEEGVAESWRGAGEIWRGWVVEDTMSLLEYRETTNPKLPVLAGLPTPTPTSTRPTPSPTPILTHLAPS